MSILSEKLVALLSKKFNLDLLEQIKFWEKPLSLQLLNKTVLEKLNNFLGELSPDLNDFDLSSLNKTKLLLKNNPETNGLLNQADNLLDEEILSDLLKECQNINDDNIENITNEITNLDYNGNFLDAIEKTNDLENKVLSTLGNYKNKAISYTSLILVVYYIGRMLVDIFNQSDFPAIFRLKYIQKLIRVTLATIWNDKDPKIQKLKRFLVIMDAIAIAVGLASSVYLFNMLKTQNEAETELYNTLCPEIRDQIVTEIEEITTTPLEDDFDLKCVIENDNDDVIVPHQPYDENIDNICKIPADIIDKDLEADLGVEIAINAIIKNEREGKMVPTITVGSYVTDETIIATLEGHSVYSPTNGYITSLNDASIALSDISDPQEDYLTRNINLLNEKYTEYNYIKSFVRNWEVKSLYPVMMKSSPETDSTIASSNLIIYQGVNKRFDKIKKEWGKINDEYEKNVKKITGKDNIETNANNDTLYKIKEELEKEEELLNRILRTTEVDAVSIAKKTNPKNNEFELIEYYLFELGLELNGIKEPNKYEKSFRDQINIFTEQRFLLDGFKPDKVGEKIGDLLKDLEKGATNGKKWFEKGVDKYNEKKKLSDVKDWLENIENPKKLEAHEKELLVNKIYYLYEFYFNIGGIIGKYTPDPSTNQIDPSINKIEEDNKQQVIKEGNYIENFFGNLWKRFEILPDEIKEIEGIIEDLAIFSAYSIEGRGEDQTRVYTISPEKVDCEPPGGFTEADFSNIKYWLKYCTFATLSSVLNPITGWSTGLILPSGPLRLPTVYIPIKPIATQYGFIVIGLTITGLWVFPMILMVNYSTEYAMPILDPTALLKKQLEKLKKEINEQLAEFKESMLKEYLDKKREALDIKIQEGDEALKIINEHKLSRPSNTKKNEKKLNAWTQIKNELQIPIDGINLEKFKLEQQWQIVNDVFTSGGEIVKGEIADAGLKVIETTEALIEKQFDRLNDIIDRMSILVAPLPTTLQPSTANFGFTLKNPNPVINIADNLDDNINKAPLNKIVNKFKVNNEGFMSGEDMKFKSKEYSTALNVAGIALIKKDPFPVYEKLNPITNPQWLLFLTKDFVPTGAKVYGIPGQMPLPIG